MRGCASLEKHKRKKPFKTQGYKRMCELNKLREKANARGYYNLHC